MSGWTITHVEGGGHRVVHMNSETGEETLAGEFGPEVPVEEVIEAVVASAEVADWIIANGEPLLVVDGPGEDAEDEA